MEVRRGDRVFRRLTIGSGLLILVLIVVVLVEEPTGAPAVIDFSLALVRPASWNLPGRWLFERAQRLDRLALERIRLRYQAGASASDARAEQAGPPPRFHAWGRALKRGLARVRGKRS